MNKDEKKALRNLAIFAGVKVALWMGIYYAAKAARKAADRYAPL